MKACSNLELQQVFTSYNNPKGNADTEKVIRTMKEELFWLGSGRVKEKSVASWISGLSITTEATFIQLSDTAHRFRWNWSIIQEYRGGFIKCCW